MCAPGTVRPATNDRTRTPAASGLDSVRSELTWEWAGLMREVGPGGVGDVGWPPCTGSGRPG